MLQIQSLGHTGAAHTTCAGVGGEMVILRWERNLGKTCPRWCSPVRDTAKKPCIFQVPKTSDQVDRYITGRRWTVRALQGG